MPAERMVNATSANAAIRRVFSQHPDVTAVYAMPPANEDENTQLRLAIVFSTHVPSADAQLIACVHALELETNAIVDVFTFEESLCPPVANDDVIYARNGHFESDNEFYLVYNEDDPLNDSKIASIEQFADIAGKNPRALDALREAIAADAPEQDATFAYKRDWQVYLTEYPTDLLLEFLKSRNSHLKTISPSSPILRYGSRWRQYA